MAAASHRIGRRAALLGAAGLAAGAGAPPRPVTGLNDHAMRGNRFYGSAINDNMLRDDHEYMAQVRVECGIVTGETAFKWGELHPKPGVWEFECADALMAFAARRAMQVRGHTLLWHEHNPDWLIEQLSPATAETLLVNHIRTVAGHCRGKVVHWDVVNEVLKADDGKPQGMRDTLWFKAMGPALLDVAFHACAEADPTPLRFINDYGLDYDWPGDERKRGAMLDLLAGMKARGVPVQGLGIQAHLEGGVGQLNQTKLSKFVADVAGLGMKLVITELDVRDNRLPADPAVRDAAVAAHARAYLDAVLPNPAVLGVLTWGLSDRRSWLNDDLPRDDKLVQRALPLDFNLKRKPLWATMAEAFVAAPMRS